MAKATNAISRRSMFSSALAAGAALSIPVAALAATEVADDQTSDVFQKQLATLGKALHEGRIDVQWAKSKTRQAKHSKFTIRLERHEDAEFMGALLAGTIFAGLCTKDEIISKLEKNRPTANAAGTKEVPNE